MGEDNREYGPQPGSDPVPWTPANEQWRQNQRLIGFAGLALLLVSVVLFCSIGWVRVREYVSGRVRDYSTWLEFLTGEAPMLLLFAVSGVLAFFGSRLLSSSQLVTSRSLPREDYALVRKAVIKGKSGPIDEYIKLRSLTGWSGTFRKLGITGLPLTTVALTILFSMLSLLPNRGDQFLDLAKLTLGAFIGSFVQRGVEQQKELVIAAEKVGREVAEKERKPESGPPANGRSAN